MKHHNNGSLYEPARKLASAIKAAMPPEVLPHQVDVAAAMALIILIVHAFPEREHAARLATASEMLQGAAKEAVATMAREADAARQRLAMIGGDC